MMERAVSSKPHTLCVSSQMTSAESSNFESHFGCPVPTGLAALFADSAIQQTAPIEFSFKHVPFVLEIQVWLSPDDVDNYDVDRGLVAFGITPDGNTVLADLSSDDLNIIQNERGDFDAIGISVSDLLSAKWRGYP